MLPKLGRSIIDVILQSVDIQCYLIGGAVRDMLLLRPTIDIDILIASEPVRAFPVILEKLKQHFSKVEVTQDVTDYLTAKVLVSAEEEQIEIDLVFTRKEEFLSPGDKAKVSFGTFETDINRRDFSINSLALKLSSGGEFIVVDIVDGLSDLRDRKIKILHSLSFRDDPVRILRGLRFSFRLGFDFEADTLTYVKETIDNKYMLNVSLGRRVFEIGKFASEPEPFKSISLANEYGVLAQSLSVPQIQLEAVERYQNFIQQLGLRLGLWAYIISSIGLSQVDFLSVLPLRKPERKLMLDAVSRGR